MQKYKSKLIEDRVQADATRFIGEIVKKTGMSPTQIARKSGLSPSTLTRIYPVASIDYTLSARTIAKIKIAFPEITADINQGAQKLPSAERVYELPLITGIAVHALVKGTLFESERANADGDLENLLVDIEVWEGLSVNPVGHIAWMEDTSDDADRFIGIYIAGDAMIPRVWPGEIAIIDTVKPVPVHSDAFIRLQLEDQQHLVFFARITERTATDILAKCFGSSGDGIRIPRRYVTEMFPVIAILTNSF